VRGTSLLFYNPVHGFQPPLGTAARAVSVPVQSRRDAPKGVALAAEVRNLRQRGLFRGVRLQVPLVGRQPVAEHDVADPLAVATFVPQRIAGPLPDSFESLGLSF
jgi:hypothetical protein